METLLSRLRAWLQYKISERRANRERKDPIIKIHVEYLEDDFLERNK